MKFLKSRSRAFQEGNALLMVMMVTAISAIALAGALRWCSTTANINAHNNEYYRAVAAAEAATEKVISQISYDYKNNSWAYVDGRLATYRAMVPTTNESSAWGAWVFSSPNGSTNGIYVNKDLAASFVQLDSQYKGLNGYAATYSVIANAAQGASVTGHPISVGVRQQFQLATIPVFQFAIFYGILMEIEPGAVFRVNGRVHSNADLYYNSSAGLTFNSDVTAVGNVVNGYAPGDTDHSGTPGNSVTFSGEKDSHTAQLYLPIGTNNSPDSVRQILYPPPSGESPNSAMGLQRFYNKASMIITVTNGSVKVTSGLGNSFLTTIPSNQWSSFIVTTNSFTDSRENKTVLPVDINVGALNSWISTNSVYNSAFPLNPPSSIYVDDQRTLTSTQLGAVRVSNGAQLPPAGLTVATADPLYVKGNYNEPTSAYLGTTNTSTSLPASFAADAITVLSPSWSDALSASSMQLLRIASDTTVNAAFLSGIVPTLNSNQSLKYSGGVENYPRFLENWTGHTLTYNGSMVVMFQSAKATNGWVYGGNVYNAPNRNWAFDLNFLDPRKLPPGTPALSGVVRGSWGVLAAGTTSTNTASTTAF